MQTPCERHYREQKVSDIGLSDFNSAPTDESQEPTTQDHIILNK